MALVHRVTTNFPSLLSNYYCKCVVNIKICRWKSYAHQQSTLNNDTKIAKEKKISFDEMLNFRRKQASKSILIQLNSLHCGIDCRNYCYQFGKIAHVFYYTLKMKTQHFMLVEFELQESVRRIKNSIGYMQNHEYVPVETSILWYQNTMAAPKGSRELTIKSNDMQVHSFSIPNLKQIEINMLTATNIAEQMTRLHRMFRTTELEKRLRFYTAQQLELCFSKLFPTLTIVPFGSSVNGFGQIGCDLDLLCKLKDESNNDRPVKNLWYQTKSFSISDRDEQKQFLTMLSNIINHFVPGVCKMQKILEARVPILKFFNKHTNIWCDLSSTNMIALYMSELLFYYGELDWRVKPLVCTIRKWARYNNITSENPGHWITNFSLTLLIIFYLQQKLLLPPLIAIKKQIRSPSTKISNRQLVASLSTNPSTKSENVDTLDVLLLDFFKYYSTFDFGTHGICIRQGTKRIKRNCAPLYIYNPFEPLLNVSRNVNWNEVISLRRHITNALDILERNENNNVLPLIGITSNKDMQMHTLRNYGDPNIVQKSNNNDVDLKSSESVHDELLTNEGSLDDSKKLEEIIK